MQYENRFSNGDIEQQTDPTLIKFANHNLRSKEQTSQTVNEFLRFQKNEQLHKKKAHMCMNRILKMGNTQNIKKYCSQPKNPILPQ